MVKNPLDALFAHFQTANQGQSKSSHQTSGANDFLPQFLVFQDFRFKYCRWTVCENGEEEDEQNGAL
jgi:hypothetical protein